MCFSKIEMFFIKFHLSYFVLKVNLNVAVEGGGEEFRGGIVRPL